MIGHAHGSGMYDLSILIPSRNEMFLKNTIEGILQNIEGRTEIIVVLDGALADPQIDIDPRVTVVYNQVSIGQRAATNQGCRLSTAKYVMKCDAHCAFDKGFDVKMMADMQDNWTMVPIMRNLHAFDWVCSEGHRRYQGPSGPCAQCQGETKRDIVWNPKPSPQSTSYCFDTTLHFQYFKEFAKRPEGQGELTETMSLQGSCFMMTRDKYWELDICDEKHGSWGQQGVEVACKTWLSGGKVICNQKTWYAHMFRTQGGDFSFPYPMASIDQEKAREYSRNIWLNDAWDKAIHPLSWLIDKFRPPYWDNKKSIVYYTDNKLKIKLAKLIRGELKKTGLPIVSASLKPLDFGQNIHIKSERGYLTMFKQILAALEATTGEVVFFTEHDVLYHPTHFDFMPPDKDKFYYNTNVWKTDGIKAVRVEDCRQTSGLCAYRELLLTHYRRRVELVEKNGFSRKMGFEPGTHNRAERVDDYKSEPWESTYPNVDIRHSNNLTSTKWNPEDYRNSKYARGWCQIKVDDIEGWDNLSELLTILH